MYPNPVARPPEGLPFNPLAFHCFASGAELYSCTCFNNAKNFTCKHTVALQMNNNEIPGIPKKNIQLGKAKGRGRYVNIAILNNSYYITILVIIGFIILINYY